MVVGCVHSLYFLAALSRTWVTVIVKCINEQTEEKMKEMRREGMGEPARKGWGDKYIK